MINKVSIFVTIIIIALMIGIPTYFNIKKDHDNKLIVSIKMEISSAAKDCFLRNICSGNETTLKFLYDNNLLDKQVNPKTKEYYDENSKIYYKNKKIVLDFI